MDDPRKTLDQPEVDLASMRWTLATLERTMHDLQKTLAEFPDKMAETYVRLDVYREQQRSLTSTVEGHTSTFVWLARGVIGTLIAGLIMALLFTTGTVGR
jgi:hypothetical protein